MLHGFEHHDVIDIRDSDDHIDGQFFAVIDFRDCNDYDGDQFYIFYGKLLCRQKWQRLV